MKKKRTIIIAVFILTLSLGALKFLTWLYGQSNTINENVNVEICDLVAKGNAIKINSYKSFQYGRDGLFEIETITPDTNPGNIVINATIDNKAAIDEMFVDVSDKCHIHTIFQSAYANFITAIGNLSSGIINSTINSGPVARGTRVFPSDLLIPIDRNEATTTVDLTYTINNADTMMKEFVSKVIDLKVLFRIVTTLV